MVGAEGQHSYPAEQLPVSPELHVPKGAQSGLSAGQPGVGVGPFVGVGPPGVVGVGVGPPGVVGVGVGPPGVVGVGVGPPGVEMGSVHVQLPVEQINAEQ